MKQPTKNFGFRIPEDLLKKLKYIAKYDCRSTGSMVRMLIYDCVEKFEKEHGEIDRSLPGGRGSFLGTIL